MLKHTSAGTVCLIVVDDVFVLSSVAIWRGLHVLMSLSVCYVALGV